MPQMDSAIPYNEPSMNDAPTPVPNDNPTYEEPGLPLNPNEEVPNPLPIPMEIDGGETANLLRTIRPISFEVPAVAFPNVLRQAN